MATPAKQEVTIPDIVWSETSAVVVVGPGASQLPGSGLGFGVEALIRAGYDNRFLFELLNCDVDPMSKEYSIADLALWEQQGVLFMVLPDTDAIAVMALGALARSAAAARKALVKPEPNKPENGDEMGKVTVFVHKTLPCSGVLVNTPKAPNRVPLLIMAAWDLPTELDGAVFDQWTHTPSSQCQAAFLQEVNSARLSRGLRPLSWNLVSPVVAFTDGSCPLNGKPNAVAGFSTVITGAHFGLSVYRGRVQGREYSTSFRSDGAPVAPSNNRAELLGIIHCLRILVAVGVRGRVEIVSDSNICIQTLLEWLPNRRKKGTAEALKNFDLVVIAERLLAALRKRAAEVVLTHCRGHQPKPPPGAPPRDRFLHRGNELADEHAGLAAAEDVPGYADAPWPALKRIFLTPSPAEESW